MIQLSARCVFAAQVGDALQQGAQALVGIGARSAWKLLSVSVSVSVSVCLSVSLSLSMLPPTLRRCIILLLNLSPLIRYRAVLLVEADAGVPRIQSRDDALHGHICHHI